MGSRGMSRQALNTVGNLVGTGLQSLFPAIFAAVYIRMLGDERYGLVGLFSILTVLSTLLDFGLSRTVTREVARCSATPDEASELRSKVLTLFGVTGGLALLFATTVVLGSRLIAGTWLNLQAVTLDEAATSVALLGATLAFQQPRAIWGAVLNGLQKQVRLNAVTTLFAGLRGLAAIAALTLFGADMRVFFGAQLVVGIVELGCFFGMAWSALPSGTETLRWRGDHLRQVWRFAGADGLATVLGMFMMVGDKVLLSAILPLDDFGRYSFVAMYAAILVRATAPFLQAYFPHFVQLAAKGDEQLGRTYSTLSQILASLVIPAAAMLVFFAPEVITLMAGGPRFVDRFAPVVVLLALGTLINALMRLPHALQLAAGRSTPGMWMNLASVGPYLVAVLLLTPELGVRVPAAAWLVVNAVAFPFMVAVAHRAALPGLALSWTARSILLPSLVAFSLAALLHALAPDEVRWGLTLPWLLCGGALIVATTALVAPDSRRAVREAWARRLGSGGADS